MEAPTTSEDFRSGVGSVDDKPSSSTTTLEDAPSSSFTSPENACTTKKTKDELKEEEERTIFVGNLPPDISRRSLAGIFKPCGSVASTRLRSIAVAGVKLPPEQAGNQVREEREFVRYDYLYQMKGIIHQFIIHITHHFGHECRI